MSARCMTLSFLLGSLLTTSAYADTSAGTRHPIVLAHGMAGFDHLFGVVDYFYGIASTLIFLPVGSKSKKRPSWVPLTRAR